MRNRAFLKDIGRTLKNNLSRFIALVVMAALGTGVFAGFAAGCMDVYRSADRFYDTQNTYDIRIASTLGLTEDDLSAVSGLETVRSAFGSYSMDVMITQEDGNQRLANLAALDSDGMNLPYVLEGTLPTKSGQLAVTSKFTHDTGLQLGDTVTLSETAEDKEEDGSDNAPSLAVTQYEITAIVVSPLDISNKEGSASVVSFTSSSTDYMLFATKDCIKSDIYTTLYLTLDGAAKMDCYSEEYRTMVEGMTATIEETIQSVREQARYTGIVEEANTRLADAEQELADKITETDQKLEDAQLEIGDGWKDYRDGLEELKENEEKLTEGQQALDDARKTAEEKFSSAQKKLDDNLAELNSNEKKLKKQEADASEQFEAYERQLQDSRGELDTQKSAADSQLDAAVLALSEEAVKIWNSEAASKAWEDMVADGVKAAPYLLTVKQGETPAGEETENYNAAMEKLQSDTQALTGCFAAGGAAVTQEQINAFAELAITYGTLDYSQTKLEESQMSLEAQKSEALKQIDHARLQIEDGKAKLADGQKELDRNREEAEEQFDEKQAELQDGMQKLEDGRKKLSDAEEKLASGQAELDQNKHEYADSVALARQELEEARKELANIEMAKWYVWDRSENDSYTGLDNDTGFIQAVTRAFPVIFFLVAILISLTTMTRMVEEDRGLIGTYKSIGYTKYRISMKYILYAVSACITGGILGAAIGYYAIPQVIGMIMGSMYVLPEFQLFFYPAYGLGGFGLFLLGIVGATVFACAEMLHKRPSELMRPKPPKEGSRILLERIPFLWKRFNFLNKVTARNLFRYKKRAIMTIAGITGCMMLIVLGFGIRDTVGVLMSDQYNKVTVYDAIVVTDGLNAEEMAGLDSELKASGMVSDTLQLQISTLTLWSGGNSMDITVMVIPDDDELGPYVHLKDIETNKERTLSSDGIAVTQNAAKQLKLKSGDMAALQNEDHAEFDFPVVFVTKNNAGNYIYIRESCYQAAFGDYAGTSLLMNLTDASKGREWLSSLSEDNRILTVSISLNAIETFGEVKDIIDTVVFMLIGMSAVLALTVLFTLSNINISERERELATMKVLGFKHKEVNSYVNKETLILTLLGILVGMPAGYGITYAILSSVDIADIAFHVHVSFEAYLIAALLTILFTLLVNKISNKSVRKINMVEALKSVE